MPARPIEDTPTSPYAVLGVSRHATPEDIKKAFHRKAKAAHPDAGGSTSEMAKVNQAYQILHDPHRKWEYDQGDIVESEEAYRPTTTQASRGTTQSAYTTQATQSARPTDSQFVREAAEQHAQRQAAQGAAAARIDHERVAWAHSTTLELLKYTAIPAIAAGVAETFFGGLTTGPSRWLFDLTMFIPVYFFCIGLAFTWDPSLRLFFADIARRHHTTRAERAGAMAVLVSVVPLALLWVAFVRLR